MESLFISHNHLDKPIARRVARRLGAYGIPTWLDERELRIGNRLSPTIEQHITNCGTVLVIATEAAAGSAWVKKEIAFAASTEPPKSICPIFVEDVSRHDVFTDHLGIDATDRHHFERTILKVAEAVAGPPLPPLQPEHLRAGLRHLTEEVPALALLVEGCLEGEGLSYANVQAVEEVSFHDLDFAINALYDLADEGHKQRVLYAAAHLFSKKGAGTYALENYVTTRPEHDTVLASAVGRELAAEDLDAALHLLSKTAPRDDQALADFINHNRTTMTAAQRGFATRLVTSPNRGPEPFGADAAFAGLQMLPESEDLKQLWHRWIRDGLFDEGNSCDTLAYWLGKARTESLPGWNEIVETFRSHVRKLARTADRNKVMAAVQHLRKAGDRGSPLLAMIATECESALGAAEWDHFADAEEMSIYVSAFVKAAHAGGDWAGAIDEYRKTWESVREYNKLFPQKSNGS
jgi:hypothetical protein